jgi:hypothetical protein
MPRYLNAVDAQPASGCSFGNAHCFAFALCDTQQATNLEQLQVKRKLRISRRSMGVRRIPLGAKSAIDG